jgi:hypothetical protein
VDERTRLGLGVLGAALLLGMLGDGLLRATPWGINLFLWVAALVGAAAAVAWRGRRRVAGEGRWLVPVALVFAAGLAWRDSATVVFLNLLAFLVAVALAALWGRTGRLRLAGVSEYVLGGIYAGTLSSAGPRGGARDRVATGRAGQVAVTRASRDAGRVLRGPAPARLRSALRRR